ncbi:S8 family serine peptidase [Methylorubrum extorquens]
MVGVLKEGCAKSASIALIDRQLSEGDVATSAFVLLPRIGIAAPANSAAAVALNSLPTASSLRAPVRASLPFAQQHQVDVVDSISPGGPKLAIMDVAAALATNTPQSPLRAVPLVEYNLFPAPASGPDAPAARGTTFVIECLETGSGGPIVGARVDALSDLSRTGGFTDAAGRVSLTLPVKRIDRLYINPGPTHWGAYRTGIPVADDTVVSVEVRPVLPSDRDYIRTHYNETRFNAKAGLIVGVIDTGIGTHHDLNLKDGVNTVTGEPRDLYDDWMGHGTHVAGLIGARGAAPTGVRGMAPGAQLIAYRVFSPATGTATNYAILKAMIFAADHKCDILNLSLSVRTRDEVVEEAVRDAREKGMLVVVAAGNDERKSVAYPAAYPGATAVAALGSESTLPPQSLPLADVSRPPASDRMPDEFIAAFSNFGQEIAAVGPGVGLVSTLPNNTYGMYSGTSMAAPVVAGAAACLLSREPAIVEMDRVRARSDAIERLLLLHCTKRGFGQEFEGFGMPDPSDI